VPGDPFELPALPGKANSISFGYSEDSLTFEKWSSSKEIVGLAEFTWLKQPNQLFVRRFFDSQKPIIEVSWGEIITRLKARVKGIWFRLNEPFVLAPWQHPATWGELCQVFNQQGIEFFPSIQQYVRELRQENLIPIIIGYPIPELIGEAPKVMHWQGLILPQLSNHKTKMYGQRKNEEGFWKNDLRTVFYKNKAISWSHSENLHPDEIGSRGRLSSQLTETKIILLGAGTLGSAVAELLVRGGLKNLGIFDGEILAIKNLVRHTLLISDVQQNKAEALAQRLRKIQPHTNVQEFKFHFPGTSSLAATFVREADIIIDCTASDDIPYALERYKWLQPERFFIFSLGWRAQSLHCFTTQTQSFRAKHYFNKVNPVLVQEQELTVDDPAPREGVGCWHPVFPARQDDVQLMASLTIKYIEEILISNQIKGFAVFRQQTNEGKFLGVSREDIE
jgi:molybdopterin/thiamine biosynthesis adenylyltransferase